MVDEVIIGNVGTPNEAANPAKVIALYANIPQNIPAYTVSRNCTSGIQAISEACEKIISKEGEIFIAGGSESMSNYPLLFGKKITEIFQQLFRAKTIGQKIYAISRIRPRDFKPIIALELGLTDPVCGLIMGKTAEILAKDFRISREEQDKFALMSHQRASSAIKE